MNHRFEQPEIENRSEATPSDIDKILRQMEEIPESENMPTHSKFWRLAVALADRDKTLVEIGLETSLGQS